MLLFCQPRSPTPSTAAPTPDFTVHAPLKPITSRILDSKIVSRNTADRYFDLNLCLYSAMYRGTVHCFALDIGISEIVLWSSGHELPTDIFASYCICI